MVITVPNVIIMAAVHGRSDWTTVATGTWTPGETPTLSNSTLPTSLIQELFSATVDPDADSGMATADFRELTYSMQWSREK